MSNYQLRQCSKHRWTVISEHANNGRMSLEIYSRGLISPEMANDFDVKTKTVKTPSEWKDVTIPLKHGDAMQFLLVCRYCGLERACEEFPERFLNANP